MKMGLYSWLEKQEGGVWGLVVIMSAFMIQIPSFGTSQSFGIYNIFFLQYFDDGQAAISLIGSINVGVFLGSGPIATFLMNHMSHRKVALLGATLSCIGLIGMPFAPNIVFMYGFYGVLTGLGFCLVYVPSHVLSGLYYDKKRSLATGLATSGSGIGAIIFPLLVNFLVDKYGWRGSFYIVCGINMQNFVFASLLRPVPEKLKLRYAKAAVEDEVISKKEDDSSTPKDSCPINPVSQVEMQSLSLMSNSDSSDVISETKTKSTNEIKMEVESEGEAEKEECQKEDTKMTGTGKEEQVEGDSTEATKEEERRNLIPEKADTSSTTKTSSLTHDDDTQKDVACKKCDLARNMSTVSEYSNLNELEKHGLTKRSTCSILCDYAFIIFFINNILWNMGILVIMLFGPQYFVTVGLDERSSALVFSIGGIGAFIGSIFGGIIGNVEKLRLDVTYIVITVIVGCICLCFPLRVFHTFGGLTFLFVAFAVTANMITGLFVVAVAAIVGADAIGTGMGYIMLANGIGSVAAPPLIAWVFEITGKDEMAFYLGGTFIIVAGLLLTLISVFDYFYLQAQEKKHRKKPDKIQKECLHVYCM